MGGSRAGHGRVTGERRVGDGRVVVVGVMRGRRVGNLPRLHPSSSPAARPAVTLTLDPSHSSGLALARPVPPLPHLPLQLAPLRSTHRPPCSWLLDYLLGKKGGVFGRRQLMALVELHRRVPWMAMPGACMRLPEDD